MSHPLPSLVTWARIHSRMLMMVVVEVVVAVVVVIVVVVVVAAAMVYILISCHRILRQEGSTLHYPPLLSTHVVFDVVPAVWSAYPTEVLTSPTHQKTPWDPPIIAFVSPELAADNQDPQKRKQMGCKPQCVVITAAKLLLVGMCDGV